MLKWCFVSRILPTPRVGCELLNKWWFFPAAGAVKTNNLPHVTEGSESGSGLGRGVRDQLTAKVSNVTAEVHEWWQEQLTLNTPSSDDEIYWCYANNGRGNVAKFTDFTVADVTSQRNYVLTRRSVTSLIHDFVDFTVAQLNWLPHFSYNLRFKTCDFCLFAFYPSLPDRARSVDGAKCLAT